MFDGVDILFLGKMLGLRNDSSITLSGEQIDSMDIYDLESIIEEVSCMLKGTLEKL